MPETTHLTDYDKKHVDRDRVQMAVDTKQDLRKAHFTYGNQGNDGMFVTTNMERYRSNNFLQPSKSAGGQKPQVDPKKQGTNVFKGNNGVHPIGGQILQSTTQ